MTRTISEVIRSLEETFPLAYQESYDNCGLQIGDPETPLSGIMVAVEATEEILQECIGKGCNLLITHHPLLFRGVKRISTTSYIERCVLFAIRNGVVIYALHTAIDNSLDGNNHYWADLMGLKPSPRRPIENVSHALYKLQVFVPLTHQDVVRKALAESGAGSMECYDSCSFSVRGEGRFRPLEGSHPFIGKADSRQEESVEEVCITSWVERHRMGRVEQAMLAAHPYEVPAYDWIPLANRHPSIGSGIWGELPRSMEEMEFLNHLKSSLDLPMLSYSRLLGKPIQKVAICGGSGSGILSSAIAQGADVFVTGEAKYNDYLDAFGGNILLVVVGHFESESCFKACIIDYLSSKFSNFVVCESDRDKNPVNYLN